ncbi:MAG: hypothetical protein MJ252_19290, partial [archaeon]|nr:hypothetical protein [archaeon]
MATKNLNLEFINFENEINNIERPKKYSGNRPMTSKPNSAYMRTQGDTNRKHKLRPYTSTEPDRGKKMKLDSIQPTYESTKESFNYYSNKIKNRPNTSLPKKSQRDFRKVLPMTKERENMLNKFWHNYYTEPTSCFDYLPSIQDNIPEEKKNLRRDCQVEADRNLYKYTKIDWSKQKAPSFLNHIGGEEFDYSSLQTSVSSKAQSSFLFKNAKGKATLSKTRPCTAFNQPIKAGRNIMSACPKSARQRPMSSIPSNIKKKFNDQIEKDYQYKNDFFNEKGRPLSCIQKINHPYVDTLKKDYKKIDVKSFIKTAQADKDILEIFDRSQRTRAANLAKVGDYEYYTPYQRIGQFMDYAASLKLMDLKSIEMRVNQLKGNIGVFNVPKNKNNSKDKNSLMDKIFTDPNILFPGLMILEDEGYRLSKEGYEPPPRRIGNRVRYEAEERTYDPMDFLPKYKTDIFLREENYPQDFKEELKISLKNFRKYLMDEDGDDIEEEEISEG